jgi:hypothetical protein
LKLLLVSKDLGGAQVIVPLAEVAMGCRNELIVVTEGLAQWQFASSQVPLYFQGTSNFLEVPFSLDVDKLIERVEPDLVVVSLGSPINLEDKLALAANRAGVPLVLVEDCHGAHVRTAAKPQLVLTLDEYAAGLVRRAHPQARVEIVGNPGVSLPKKADDLERAAQNTGVANLRRLGVRTYAYVGGDPISTEEQLRLLINCLEQTSGDWILIPRFHPKWVNVRCDRVPGFTYGEYWSRLLVPLGDRVKLNLPGDAHELVASVDVTIADYSTLLTFAVCCGKTAVFLETPSVIRSMVESTGLAKFPLVELGCAHCVRQSVDLSSCGPPQQDKLQDLRPYDPELAYRHLSSLLR